jgi:hypothetical protein
MDDEAGGGLSTQYALDSSTIKNERRNLSINMDGLGTIEYIRNIIKISKRLVEKQRGENIKADKPRDEAITVYSDIF